MGQAPVTSGLHDVPAEQSPSELHAVPAGQQKPEQLRSAGQSPQTPAQASTASHAWLMVQPTAVAGSQYSRHMRVPPRSRQSVPALHWLLTEHGLPAGTLPARKQR